MFMQNLVLITPENLKLLMIEVLDAHFQKVMPSTKHPDTREEENQYFTREEVSQKIHISLPTLNKYMKEGKIKYHRIGRRILFKHTDIENAILKSKH